MVVYNLFKFEKSVMDFYALNSLNCAVFILNFFKITKQQHKEFGVRGSSRDHHTAIHQNPVQLIIIVLPSFNFFPFFYAFHSVSSRVSSL